MPTDIKKIVKEVQKILEANKNQKNVKKYSKFFTEGYDAYGLDKKTLEKKRAEFVDKYKEELGLKGFLNLGSELLKSGKYEEASLAVTFPVFFKNEINKKDLKIFKSWLEKGIRNWAHTDILCSEVIKIMLLKKIINYTDLAEWRYSKSKWTRRAVPVSLLCLVKEKIDHKDLLVFVMPLMNDENEMVQKAIGWLLREIWKVKPRPAEAFLLKYKDTSPRLIIQYATEKMNKEKKVKYKIEKKKKSKP
jgi:3-methyladenine DNA glycosylase AlkD